MGAKVEERSTLDKIDSRLKVAVFLTPFMTFYLPFVAEIIVILFQLSIIWLIYNLKNKTHHSTFQPINKYIFSLIFIISATASTIPLIAKFGWSGESIASLFRYMVITTHCIFILSLIDYFKHSEKLPFKYLPLSILACSLLIFIDINIGLTGIDYHNGRRIIVSSNIRFLGHIAIVSSLYVSIKILLNNRTNSTFFILSIVSLSILIWLGGRGAIMSYLLSLFLALFLIYKNLNTHKANILKLINYIIISAILSTLLSVFSWNGFNRLNNPNLHYQEDINSISSGRVELWKGSLDYIIEKPYLGHGADGYMIIADTIYRHPHNFLLQWLFNFGVIGTLILTIFIFYISIIGYNNILKDGLKINIFPLCCFVGLVSNAIVSGTLYYSPPMFILCIVSAFIVATYEKKIGN